MGNGQGPLEGVVMNPDFWNGRKVFLTGHTGFKGSWLSLWLEKLGAQVFGFALAPAKNPNLFETAKIYRNMQSVFGDVRDLSALQKAVSAAKPTVIFHMAAQPLVVYSYANPVETYATNVMGTVHLLESVRNCDSVRAVVNVTTDKCYENKEWLWPYRENDVLGGHDPYSNSKACSELVTAAFRTSYFNEEKYVNHGLAVATARAGNVIGGGDWSENRLIPDILKALESGQNVRIRNPNAIRPWQHVLEPLRGYLTLAEKLVEYGPQFAQSWNFGPQQEDAQAVGDIAKDMCLKWGSSQSWVVDPGDHPNEANYLKLDISKSAKHLDWKPKVGLEQALEMIIKWHRAFLNKEDMRQFTLEQITKYQGLIK
jgi:CDP-glucose 4,6-dehydratase